MVKQLAAFFCLTAITLSGCGLVYKAPIQQGNIITQSSLAQLKLGMTQAQVSYLLGTPVLSDTFSSPDVWEYVDYYDSRRGKVGKKSVSLSFKDGKLIKIQPLNTHNLS